ncbi:uncharacterized protein LOC133174790 [Saccostrea echinata]|uniref:uncharacterized protein LOC133174790 n=1 Tax=Saccostrea echinata TaxID=191078 RepID=UPI002A7F29B4|nr:uncharacterized protein LOC133174790 [Saccostrea echinata]
MWCASCELPVCFNCSEHRKHEVLDIKSAYKRNRQLYKSRILHFRSEILPMNRASLASMKADFKTEMETLQLDIARIVPKITNKVQRLKHQIDVIFPEQLSQTSFNLVFCLQSMKKKLQRRISIFEKYENRCVLLSKKPLQFLPFFKKTKIKKEKSDIFKLSILLLNEKINKDKVTKLLGAFHITGEGKREVGNEWVLKPMSSPVLKKSVAVTGLLACRHISYMSSDQFWVSDTNNLIKTNSAGDTLTQQINVINSDYGVHTATNSGELIFIDDKFNINKISFDSKTTNLIGKTGLDSPLCVYFSPFNGDLLVGMGRYNSEKRRYSHSKVIRYNSSLKLVQTIKNKTSDKTLYSCPIYITENHNRDILVSDTRHYNCGAVVVTDGRGNHRFSYKRHPSGLPLDPRGICTDTLSHILVCDVNTHTIHVLDKDGQFLFMLLRKQQEMFRSYSLAFDVTVFCICFYDYGSTKSAPCIDTSPEDCSDQFALQNICSDPSTAIFCKKSCGLCFRLDTCLACDGVHNPLQPCPVIPCHPNEVCYTGIRVVGSTVRYVYGCLEESICYAFAANDHIKVSDRTDRYVHGDQGTAICDACCKGDKCNAADCFLLRKNMTISDFIGGKASPTIPRYSFG